MGSTVVCCVCSAVVVAAEVIVAAAVVAAAAASSLAASWPVAKELVRVCSLDACANVLQVVSSAAMEVVKHLVARVGFCLSL